MFHWNRPENHPPGVRPVLHIGVTGHRPPRLSRERFSAVQDAVRLVLEKLADEFAEVLTTDPEKSLCVITSLAEGADQLAARAALDCGMEIQCPLPFHRDEYERDFPEADARREYRRLLGYATTVLELDGNRDDEGTAYLNAGRVMLEQSDVFLAIWDEGKAGGRGGTAQIVAEARETGIPVIVIQPSAPHDICVLDAENPNEEWMAVLRKRLRGKPYLPRLRSMR